MSLKQKRSKTRTNDDRRNALLWEIKARETDDVKRKCQYYYRCDIHYFCKEQIKLLHMWQNIAPKYIRFSFYIGKSTFSLNTTNHVLGEIMLICY